MLMKVLKYSNLYTVSRLTCTELLFLWNVTPLIKFFQLLAREVNYKLNLNTKHTFSSSIK